MHGGLDQSRDKAYAINPGKERDAGQNAADLLDGPLFFGERTRPRVFRPSGSDFRRLAENTSLV
jgi:hypothetical protein